MEFLDFVIGFHLPGRETPVFARASSDRVLLKALEKERLQLNLTFTATSSTGRFVVAEGLQHDAALLGR